jgi:hypothetical protein
MKRGFFTIMAAQFFSSLADNALFVAAVRVDLRYRRQPNGSAPAWCRCSLCFTWCSAPFVGAFADSMPKGRVMFAQQCHQGGRAA